MSDYDHHGMMLPVDESPGADLLEVAGLSELLVEAETGKNQDTTTADKAQLQGYLMALRKGVILSS
jgi:hypothetical protein